MNNEAIQLFKLHPVSKMLGQEAIQEIGDAGQVIRLEDDTVLHQADEIVQNVYLIIHGQLRLKLRDRQGHVIFERLQRAGTHFGALAAALGEALPLECSAYEPTTLLSYDYATYLELIDRFPEFGLAISKSIADSIRSYMWNERQAVRPRAVAMLYLSPDARELIRSVIIRLRELGETVNVLTDDDEPHPVNGVRYYQVETGGGDRKEASQREFVAKALGSGRLLVTAGRHLTEFHKRNVLEKCEDLYCVVTRNDWKDVSRLVQSLIKEHPPWREKLCFVWLLNDATEVAPPSEAYELAGSHLKLSQSPRGTNCGRLLVDGFRRWIHRLRGVRIGIALGGGAARGMAHLGVLKALEENDIVIDMIAGTSAGAMTGTMYASNLEVNDTIQNFCHDLRPSWFFRSIPKGDQWYLLYKYRTGQFDPMLRKYLGDLTLGQLPVSMLTITVDLVSGRAIVREQGDAVHSILESINLPVVSKPINRNGQSLVDGGLINNVPANVLTSRGCNYVIASSVTAQLETEFARNRPDTPSQQMRPASIIQTLLRSYFVQNHSLNALGVAPADTVIEPDVSDFQLTEFTRTDELAAIGEKAALSAIDEIKQQLHRLDPQLFP